MTHFLKGNQLWKLRSKIGANAIFTDKQTLIDEACLYFDWCDRNPYLRPELIKYQGSGDIWEIPIGRPYSIDGLTLYLGVSGRYFGMRKAALTEKLEANKITDDERGVLEAIEWIEQVCRTQQIEGAIVRIFSETLISRLNYIADNINTHNTGTPALRVIVRDKETADMLDELDSLL